jgi:hypothetical protein
MRLLASNAVVVGLRGIATRELGCFQPAGKSMPLVIHEVLSWSGDDELHHTATHNCAAFEQGLNEFRAGDWLAARAAFADYLCEHEDDGPAQFYLGLCARYQRSPPVHWQGIVTLRGK